MEQPQSQQTHQPNEQIDPLQLPSPNQSYATFQDFSVGRLTCTPPEQKTVPGTGPGANPPNSVPATFYYQIPLMYNYGTSESRILNDFLFEFCELESKFGIQAKPGQSGRMEYSLMAKFESTKPDHMQCISAINEIHRGSSYVLQQYKGVVKMPHFQVQMAEATGFKNPVYRPRDEATGDIIQGRAPSMFLKLFNRGVPPMVEQTLFTGPDQKPIPWTLLTGVEMRYIPLVHIKRIYVGSKASLQMEVVSAIVTSIKARGTSTLQTSTIHNLQQNRPDLTDTVAAQLAKLTTDRQERLINDNPSTFTVNPPSISSTEDQPTFSNITPVGRQPASPVVSAQPSMQDFTAGAPARIPGIPSGLTQGTNLQFN